MPKVSRESGETQDHGPVVDTHAEFGDYTINFITFKQHMDATEMMKGLPDDSCPCPHWGYVFKGKVTFRLPDGSEEIIEEGDAFYLPAGHIPIHEEGTEYVQFSPTKELAVVSEHMIKKTQEMQGG
jgi:redox-sensitive bicupin YhaK (pirin superfamily)